MANRLAHMGAVVGAMLSGLRGIGHGHTRTTSEGGGRPMTAAMRKARTDEREQRAPAAIAAAEAKRARRRARFGGR